MCSGAKRLISPLSATTNWRIGSFTFSSNNGLRGRNHSRLLLRARPRKNAAASLGKPGKADRTIPSPIIELMLSTEETQQRLAEIPNLTVFLDAPLSRYTRFGIGGPADVYAETESVDAFVAALTSARASGWPVMVIGDGTNLIVSGD